MKTLGLAIALTLLAGSAQAAKLSGTTYKTAREAALKNAAYAFTKANKRPGASASQGKVYRTADVYIAKAIDTTGPSQKFLVKSKNGIRQKTMYIKKDAPGKYRAYNPTSKETSGDRYRQN